MQVSEACPRVRHLVEEIERVIVGKRPVVELALVAFFAEGHLLIEDVPGVGKTMLARSLARSLDCSFKRIQFTPDLLPSDITGTSVFNQKTSEFNFHPGPVFANIVLADEINRATPKTQSSLLEGMEEFQVSVDGVTHILPRPFFVIATQNNIEYQGTFPLPEAQLDRFVMRLSLGYPSADDEATILSRQERYHPIQDVRPVLAGAEVKEICAALREVHISPAIKDYIVALVQATRAHPSLALGASPRGSLDLLHCSQVLAGLRGRSYVLPDDIKLLAPYVLPHRLVLQPEARLRRISGEQTIRDVMRQVPVPVDAAPSRA
ncbi:MAG: MoxR family ATPase [Armatimonadetes bacterium]|nr:MoxR family ATPase [Armatimonadota bacterium]